MALGGGDVLGIRSKKATNPHPNLSLSYRCFCVMINGPNSSGLQHLVLGGIEVYGELFKPLR